MHPERPWGENYRDDPATAELIRRGVVIPHHEDLHREARSFLDPPFKAALGRWNTELLGMHHYTTHLKIGIAREYLDELDEKLRTHTIDLATAQALLFNKLLDGFFTNLMGAFDNLTQELNLVYDLGLDERASFHDILSIASVSKKRLEKHRKLPTDDRMARLVPILTATETGVNLRKIAGYRNYITHRKLPSTFIAARATVSLSPPPLLTLPENNEPSQSSMKVAKTVSGGVAFKVPEFKDSGSLQQGPSSKEATALPFQAASRIRFVLPKLDKLDLLPTEATADDLDSREIVNISEELYRWAVDCLGGLYEALVDDFRNLPIEPQ